MKFKNYIRTITILLSFLIISIPLIHAQEINYVTDANGNLVTGDNFYREYNELNQLIRIREGNVSTGKILEEYTWHPVEERILIKDVYYNNTKNYTVYYVSKEYVVIENKTGNYTEEHLRQAEALQQDAKLVPNLATVLDQFIVGEANKKLLSYLNEFSTKLKRDKRTPPNHTRLVSPTSAGKTHLIGSTLELFPKESKIILGGSSRMALKYGEPDYIDKDELPVIDFDGKILWFLEEKGGEASYDISITHSPQGAGYV